MLWKSANGKWAITAVKELETGYIVIATWLTKNLDWEIEIRGNEVVKVSKAKLPKMVSDAALKLVNGGKVESVKSTAAPEKLDVKSIATLTQIARKFLAEEFNLSLNIPIQVNNRLSRALGRFVFRNSHYEKEALRIELSGDLLNHYNEGEIVDVLKHELVHYALFTLGIPYKDGEKPFEDKLRELGVKSTRVHKHKGNLHVYTCSECDKVVARTRRRLRYNGTGYVSNCCKSLLNYNGTVTV